MPILTKEEIESILSSKDRFGLSILNEKDALADIHGVISGLSNDAPTDMNRMLDSINSAPNEDFRLGIKAEVKL